MIISSAHKQPRITITQIATYWRYGFLVVPSVLPLELCDDIVEHAHAFDTARQHVFDPIMQPHLSDPWFRNILAFPPIVSLISDILGEVPDGLQTLFYFGRPSPRGFIIHQDNFCVEAGDNDFLSTWIALTDVGRQNGCLRVFPRTHTRGILPATELDPSEVNEQFKNMTASPDTSTSAEPIDVPFFKGDLVVLHGNLLHCSNPNRTTDMRYSHLNTYIRPNTPFRPGNTAQRKAEKLPGLTTDTLEGFKC